MITIIHLSDLHIHGSNNEPDNRNAKKLVKHLKDRFKGYKRADTYMVITGDLVDDASLKQYKNLSTAVLQPLAKQFTILAVPGNHDYAYKGNLFLPPGPGRYEKHVLPYIKGGQSPGPQRYPFVTESSNGEPVVFIGLDSADRQDEAWFAEGYIGEAQIKSLELLLKDSKYANHFKILYLHHHPFMRGFFDIGMKLHNADELLELIDEKVNLVLFGHKHKHEAFFNWYHVDVMLASGKVTQAAGGNGLAYRVLEIENGTLGQVRTEETPSI